MAFFVFKLCSLRQDSVLSQAGLGGILRRVGRVEQERTRVLNTISRADVPGSGTHTYTTYLRDCLCIRLLV